MSIAMAFLFWQWFILRDPQTHLFAVVVNQGQKKSGQQDNLSIAPLRFTQKFPKAIGNLGSAKNFHLTEELSLGLLTLEERLVLISKGAQRQDTLLCSIQAQCMTIQDEAVLIDANFLLPDGSIDPQSETTRGIPIAKLLGLYAIFPGTVILALDAGDVIADTAALCEQNDFLLKLQDSVKKVQNNRLWVLTSHSPTEISQDDLATSQRLFGRAMVESLLGTFRVSNSEEWFRQWSVDRRLSLDEFANYVHRRVQADSGKSQTPWLLRGGEGLVRSDKAGWNDARTVYLAKLDKLGRVEGIAASKPADTESPTKSAGSQLTPEQMPTEKVPADKVPTEKVPADKWIQNWQKFEANWDRKTSETSYAWTIAECFPMAYRQRRAELANAELRGRAGISDSIELSYLTPLPPADWNDQLRQLYESNPTQKRWDASELDEKREQGKLLQHICQASLHVAELRQLTTRLDAIGERPQSQLLRLVDSFRSRSNPGELRVELKPALDGLHVAIDSLISEAIAAPKMAVIESLLQCGSLTAEQRERILNKRMNMRVLDDFPTSIPESPASWSKPLKSVAVHRGSVAPTNANANANANAPNELAKSIATLVEQGLLDDRLVARKDQFVSAGSQIASLPSVPTRRQGWWPEWQQMGGLLAQPLRLEPTQRMEFSLRLDPLPKPNEIRIQLGTFPSALRNLKLDGQRIDDSNPTFVRKWSAIEQNSQTIKVELESLEFVSPSLEKMSLKISGDTGPTHELVPLQLRLASKERIDLDVKRLIRKDGKDEWWPEEASIPKRVYRLHPFAGHETRFSLDATNRGEKSRTVQADLYALPNRVGIPGILVNNNGFAQSDFNEEAVLNQVKKTGAIASVKGLELKPNQSTKVLLMPVASATAPTPDAAKPAAVPISRDVSAGMALVLSDVNDGTELESFLFEYDPTIPSEYIEAYATVVTNDQSRDISAFAQFRDANEDGVADLSPTDNQPIQVAVFREPWMGINPKGEFAGTMDSSRKRPLKLSLQLPLDASIETQTFLALDIGGFPRALARVLSLGDTRRQVFESYKGESPRSTIRSVSDGTKTYWSMPSIDLKPETNFAFGAKSLAIFKQPKQVEVGVALDWALDLVNGQMLSAMVQFGESKELIFGDRKWNYQATKVNDEGLSIFANATDHSVLIDSSGMQNKAITLQVIAMEQLSKSIEVVFDAQLPEIRAVKLTKDILFKGEETKIEFEIEEGGLSGIDRFDLLVFDNLNVEKMKLPGALQQNEPVRSSRTVVRTLPVGKLESGSYTVFVAATDLAGNGPVKSAPVKLRIRDRPTPAALQADGQPASPAVLGSIRGKVRFPNGEEPTQAKVTLDSNGKSGEFANGNFNFSEVPLGKFKITAQFPYQSSNWVGEASGEFKTAADFQKEIEIKCKKAP